VTDSTIGTQKQNKCRGYPPYTLKLS